MPVNEMLRAHVDELGDGAQHALAVRLGVSEASVSRWLNGQLIPEEKWASDIAAAIGRDEESVLAAISLSRRMRQQARSVERARAVETKEMRELRETVEALTKRLRDVEERLSAAEQNRAGPAERPKGGRSSR